MSCNYAEGLSPYENKGRLGAPEKFDNAQVVEEKVELLAEMVRNSKHIVVHTGAGISTSAGIPDFRGPKGVWTLEKKGLKPDINVSWDDAKPTVTHMALARLVEVERVKYIITQNIDGLHLRSGVPRTKISELHGNMFADQCDKCKKMIVRDSPAPTVGQKYSGQDCPAFRENGRKCRGKMRDFVLDWEDSLPDDDLTISDTHAMMADLSIVMGSTLQIIPAGNMPTYTKKYHASGKLVICNLQPTKHAKRADLNIHTYVDDVMTMLMKKLDLKIPEYNPETDPVRLTRHNRLPEEGYIDWTQCPLLAKSLKKLGDKIHDDFLKLKREEKKRKYIENCRINKLNKLQKRQADEEEEEDEDSKDADIKELVKVESKDTKPPLDDLNHKPTSPVQAKEQVQELKREEQLKTSPLNGITKASELIKDESIVKNEPELIDIADDSSNSCCSVEQNTTVAKETVPHEPHSKVHEDRLEKCAMLDNNAPVSTYKMSTSEKALFSQLSGL